MANTSKVCVLCVAMMSIALSATAAPPDTAPVKEVGRHHRTAKSKFAQEKKHSQKKDNASEAHKIELPKNLGKIIVHGHKMPPICVLETLKLALHRSYSADPAHANDLLCRFYTLTGTRIKTTRRLWCRLNKDFGGVYSAAYLDLKLPKVNMGEVRAVLANVPNKFSRVCFEPK